MSKNAILEAERCVSCGLCLQNCPTYLKTLSEADSPRGRIALMRGAARCEIPINARFVEHIDLCLDCRACERVCPNQVAYGSILRAMRKPVEAAKRQGLLEKLFRRASLFLLAHPEKIEQFGRRYLGSPIRGLLPDKLKKLDAMLPDAPAREIKPSIYPAVGEKRGDVGLFLGCVARISDSVTLRASIHVLNRLGYTVHVPQAQTCCGALHGRLGEDEAPLVERNRSAFAKVDKIVCTSSACAAELLEQFPGRVFDISRFLNESEGWENMEISPLDAKIAVHDPCSLRNVLKGEAHPYKLLERIPNAKIVALPGNSQCCGSAGSYFLTQPAMANALMDDKMKLIGGVNADVVATSNVGCAMSFKARGLRTQHPVVLLAYQMGFV